MRIPPKSPIEDVVPILVMMIVVVTIVGVIFTVHKEEAAGTTNQVTSVTNFVVETSSATNVTQAVTNGVTVFRDTGGVVRFVPSSTSAPVVPENPHLVR